MKRPFAAGLILALLLTARVSAQQTSTPAPDAIVLRASRVYRALTSWRAEFRLNIRDSEIGNEDSRGNIYQMGREKFAMRFSQPANQVYLIDGKDMWFYQPTVTKGQVTRSPAPATANYGVNAVGAFLDSPIEKYRLTYLRPEVFNGRLADVVVLDPIARMEFRRATVWFDREDGLPRKMEFVEPFLTRTLEFSKLQKNVTLAADIFVFRKPEGVRIVGP